MDPATFASNTFQFPVALDSTRPPRSMARTSLPKMWIGYALAVICLAAFMGGVFRPDRWAIGLAIANAVSFVGAVYWLYCIYRVHAVLAEATRGHYPISARRAVGFQLIPIYSLIWSFKWPKQIAEALNGNTNEQLRYRLVGVGLALAAVLGLVPTGLHLALLFTIGAYVKRHIAKAVPWAVSEPDSSRQQFDVAYLAGLGAAFGFMFGQASVDLIKKMRTVKAEEVFIPLVAIVLASCFAVLFIEPLAGKCRVVLGIPHEHFTIRAASSRRIQLALLVLLIGTTASHDLLQEHIKELLSPQHLQASLAEDTSQPLLLRIAGSRMTFTLLTPFLFAGGITYFWVAGSRRRTMGAARAGALSGAAVGVVVVLLLAAYASAANLEHLTFSSLGVLWEIFKHVQPGGKVFGLAIRGAAFGLVGGLAIQRERSRHGPRALYASLIISALLFGVLTHHFSVDLLKSLGFALGWCAGLFIHPHSEAILTGKVVEDDQAPRAASAAA